MSDVQIVCPQCGEPIEVPDVAALILALHQQNECTVSGLLVHHDEGAA